MAQVSKITPAAGVTLQGTPTTQPGKGGMVPFRTATDRKYEIGSADTLVQTAAQQLLTRVLEGTGYLSSIDIDVTSVCAGNNAAVAWAADAPWNILQNIAFKAIGPDLHTITGYSLYLLNKYGGFGVRPGDVGPGFVSVDPLVFFTSVAAAAGNGGSCHFTLKLPCAINPRNLIGLMGNQDAGTKYQLTTDISPIAANFTVAPTNAGTITVQRFLDYCSVPAALDAAGMAQQQVPPSYGVLHMANELRSEANVVSGATVNHFLRSLGNTDRLFILVFRDSTGARADACLPTRITLRVGADVKYSESSAHRRKVMFDRYGFDAPAGILVYDFISDFVGAVGSGFELGDDWFNSNNIPNAQFECTYPVIGNTPGSLTIITDQLVIPSNLDVKSFV